jgi:cell division inhibitor SepF
MGFVDKMKNLVGIDDYDDDDFDISQEEIDAYKNKLSSQAQPASAPSPAPAHTETPVSTGIRPLDFKDVVPPMQSMAKPMSEKASMNQSGPFKMVVIEPKSLDECRKLVDNLRARKPVIINLEKVETDLARKMFDFLGGATYALSGTVQRVNQNIYIFAPNNVNIKAMVDRATEAGKPANSNPWK